MKLRAHPFLIDQNVKPAVSDWLRSEGIDVLTCMDAGLDRAADPVILAWANVHSRVLVTHDTDFGELAIVQSQQFLGLVLIRPAARLYTTTIGQLQMALDEDVPETGRPWVMTVDIRDGQPRVRLRT